MLYLLVLCIGVGVLDLLLELCRLCDIGEGGKRDLLGSVDDKRRFLAGVVVVVIGCIAAKELALCCCVLLCIVGRRKDLDIQSRVTVLLMIFQVNS